MAGLRTATFRLIVSRVATGAVLLGPAAAVALAPLVYRFPFYDGLNSEIRASGFSLLPGGSVLFQPTEWDKTSALGGQLFSRSGTNGEPKILVKGSLEQDGSVTVSGNSEGQKVSWDLEINHGQARSFTRCQGEKNSDCLVVTEQTCREALSLTNSKDYDELRRQLKSCGFIEKLDALGKGSTVSPDAQARMLSLAHPKGKADPVPRTTPSNPASPPSWKIVTDACADFKFPLPDLVNENSRPTGETSDHASSAPAPPATPPAPR